MRVAAEGPMEVVAWDRSEEMGQVTGPVGVDTVQGPLLLHRSLMEELEATCKEEARQAARSGFLPLSPAL